VQVAVDVVAVFTFGVVGEVSSPPLEAVEAAGVRIP
jgi:hypothetical protein